MTEKLVEMIGRITRENATGVTELIEPMAWAILEAGREHIQTGRVVPGTVFAFVPQPPGEQPLGEQPLGEQRLVMVTVIANFRNREESHRGYPLIWASLLPRNPVVMYSINDSYAIAGVTAAEHEKYAGNLMERYKSGDQRVRECLGVVVYPRGANAWNINQLYDRRSGKVIWEEARLNRNETGDTIAGALCPEPWVRQAEIRIRERDREEKEKRRAN